MQKNKNTDKRAAKNSSLELELGSAYPMIEMLGNRRISVEGSTGILLYESENIKINTNKLVISFEGRGLNVRCVSCSCVEISGFVTSVVFIS